MSRYPQFDRPRLNLKPLAERGHDLVSSACWPLKPPRDPFDQPEFSELIARIIAARKADRRHIFVFESATAPKTELTAACNAASW